MFLEKLMCHFMNMQGKAVGVQYVINFEQKSVDKNCKQNRSVFL